MRRHPTQPKAEFWEKVGRDPLDVLYDDRGSQITIGAANATNLTIEQAKEIGVDIALVGGRRDIRTALQSRANELLAAANIPISPNFGGTCSLDFSVQCVSKTYTIERVLKSPEIMASIGLSTSDADDPEELEIWGDKFEIHDGGADRFMCIALPPSVRAIDFRDEDPNDFIKGYHIVIWDGERRLSDGLLEYLQSR